MQMKNPQNKIDFAILSEYTQKEFQQDGSLLCLKFVEEGEDAVALHKGSYGSYTLDVSRKVKRLVKFFSISEVFQHQAEQREPLLPHGMRSRRVYVLRAVQ